MHNLTFLREPQLRKRRARCKPKNYKDISDGLLTPPIKLGARCSVWPEHEINALLAAEIRGASQDEIRALVNKLVADRSREGWQ